MTAVVTPAIPAIISAKPSIEGQIRECTAYAEKNGITVANTTLTAPFSAKTDNRPDFQQMIKDSENGCLTSCWSGSLTVLPRNRYDSAHYEYQLERNHVKLVSATEPIPALQVSWSRVCSPAWLNTTPQNFLKRSCAA